MIDEKLPAHGEKMIKVTVTRHATIEEKATISVNGNSEDAIQAALNLLSIEENIPFRYIRTVRASIVSTEPEYET